MFGVGVGGSYSIGDPPRLACTPRRSGARPARAAPWGPEASRPARPPESHVASLHCVEEWSESIGLSCAIAWLPFHLHVWEDVAVSLDRTRLYGISQVRCTSARSLATPGWLDFWRPPPGNSIFARWSHGYIHPAAAAVRCDMVQWLHRALRARHDMYDKPTSVVRCDMVTHRSFFVRDIFKQTCNTSPRQGVPRAGLLTRPSALESFRTGSGQTGSSQKRRDFP